MTDGEKVFAKLKRVRQALGKWHDYEVARVWLKRFGKKKVSFAESGGVEAERYIGEKKRALRKNFTRARTGLRSVMPGRTVMGDKTAGEKGPPAPNAA